MEKSTKTLNAIGKEYVYDISVSYVLDKTETEIETGCIGGVIVKHSYHKQSMPIIYLVLNVDLTLYLNILDHQFDGKFAINIQKYVVNTVMKRDYIHSMFSYFITSDRNDNIEPETNLNSLSDRDSTSFIKIVVGLVDISTIEKNNIGKINGVFLNTNTSSLIHYMTKHMDMVFEPLKSNQKINQIIIPPFSKVSEFLKYLNNKYPFYDSPFFFYIDFDKTYLLSESGKYVDNGDKSYQKVQIDINDLEDKYYTSSKGIVIDEVNRVYYFSVNVLTTKLKINRYQGRITNKMMGININNLETHEDYLNIEYGEKDNDKYSYQLSENDKSLSQMKKSIENNMVNLYISKCDIDASIITPNKEYIVDMYGYNSQYNGKYILDEKVENLSPSNGKFILTSQLSFRKVGDV